MWQIGKTLIFPQTRENVFFSIMQMENGKTKLQNKQNKQNERLKAMKICLKVFLFYLRNRNIFYF